MTQPPQGDDPTQYGGQMPLGQPGYGHPQYQGGEPPYGGQGGYPGGYDQQPPKKRTGLIIGIVVVALILIGGAVGAIFLLGGGDDKTDSATGKSSSGETFCERFEKNAQSNEFDNPGPDDTDKVLAELGIFRQLAPDELKDDYDVLIDAVNGGQSDPSTALENIQAYAVDNCDITLDGN